MSRVNEFTPLLVNDTDKVQSHPQHRRQGWPLVLAGALSLGIVRLVHQHHAVPGEIPAVTVSVNEVQPVTNDADDATFLADMDTFKDVTVDPCVDFYDYACGGWLQTHVIPSDRPSVDASFSVVSETNKAIIQQIVDRNPAQIGPFYHSCLSDEEVDAPAMAFVAQLVTDVHQVNSTLALMELAGEMDQQVGLSTFFRLVVGADPQDPTTNVLQLAQGGLTMPSREYYLEQSKVDSYASLYVDYVTKLFAVGDLDHPNVSAFAEAVLQIETTFANISLPNAALRNPWTTSTAYPFAEIAQRYPFAMAYLNGIYKHEAFPMLHAIIATPEFFEAQNQLLSNEAVLPQLKAYVSFRLIDSFSTLLGEYFRRASHAFHGKLQGAGDLLPRKEFCMRLTTAVLGDELGKYYMQAVFGPDAKQAAEALVVEIEEALKALLLTEAWLDKVTYDAAVEKLSKVKNYIGGPDDVTPLPFELQANAFFDNVKRLMQLSAAKTIQSVGKPVNAKAWDMFPSTVNAYYDPSANKMVFPAAILQPPFYSAEHFPAAANFARIGMIMSHELSHGFDDQGRNYDSNGALRSWWTPSVSAKFAEKAQCLAAQYSAFPVVSTEDGRVLGNVNGNLTLGENIADNGGIRLAYEAYHLWKSALAPPPIVPSATVSPTKPIPNPAAISPPGKQVPEPIEAGSDKHDPVPPAVPIAATNTPEATRTEPDVENVPGGLASQSPVVPKPVPANIGPSAVVPHGITPAPEPRRPVKKIPAPPGQDAATEAPKVMPVSPMPPTLPDMPNTLPGPSNGSTPLALPDVPDTPPGPPNGSTPSKVPTVVPQPEPNVVSPDKTSKHKDTKEEEDAEKSHDSKHNTEGTEDSGKEDKSLKKTHAERHRTYESDADHDDHSSHKHEEECGGCDRKEHRDDRDERHKAEDAERHKDEDGERQDDRDKDEHGDESKYKRRKDHRHRDEEKSDGVDDDRAKGEHHHSHKVNEAHTNRERSNDDDGESDQYEHSEHESKKERREERKERKKEKDERRRSEKEMHRSHHDQDYDEDRASRRHEKHHRHKVEREERWDECGGCERKEHDRHHPNHEKDKDEERHGCGKEDAECGGSKRHQGALSESKYPFSGGDARMQSMVKKLARAIAQPNDPVADDRLFFTAFAQNWCEKRTPGYAELLRTIDVHSPGKWRVNGPLMNYVKFAEAFSCPVGTPMNPAKKCVIW